MNGEREANDWYFGRTVIRSVRGEIIDQPVQAIVYVANSRGMMEAGSSAAIRMIGGAEVEREAMSLAPHRIGSLFVTGSGRLRQRGIAFVYHIVLANMLGEAPRTDLIERSMQSILEAAEQRHVRSIAIPIIGATAASTEAERNVLITEHVEAAVSHLRRTTSRFDTIVFVSRFDDDVRLVAGALKSARERLWLS